MGVTTFLIRQRTNKLQVHGEELTAKNLNDKG